VKNPVDSPHDAWMAATLDGLVKETGAVFEAKFLLPWPPRQPQLRRRGHLVGTTGYRSRRDIANALGFDAAHRMKARA
jgi:hypothetical protein